MSRFIFAGNEIIPGTVIMTADGTITPKDDLRVILNISGGGTVSLSDGTDTTQRIEIVNVNTDPCSFTYKGTGGSTTASIYTNTGIRLLWVGTYWETSMSTAVTGIDDNSQPFAFNIDSLVKPDGVINLTGTDADGNPFDYGVGKLVTVADEDNLVTGVEVKTSKTLNGKPIYKKVIDLTSSTYSVDSNRRTYSFANVVTNVKDLINVYGYWVVTSSTVVSTGGKIIWGQAQFDAALDPVLGYSGTVDTSGVIGLGLQTREVWKVNSITGLVTVEYTKTTDA